MKKTILEVIEELTGQKAVQYSNELKAIKCPFHDDQKPSLVIYEHTNSYFCFPCSFGGDIYNFYSKFKGCSFRQAKEALDGDTNVLEEIVQTLDGIGVVDPIDYSKQLNFSLSKTARNIMFSNSEKISQVMTFLKEFDAVLAKGPVDNNAQKYWLEKIKALDKTR